MASIVEKYGSFVKDQIDYQEKQAARAANRNEEARAKAAQGRAAMFRQLLIDLSSLESLENSGASYQQDPIRLSPHDLDGLPEELLNELSLNDSDRKDFLIIEIIDDIGGTASLDRILVNLYKRTGEVEKRTKLVSRLYRMAAKELIYQHPDKKGVYTTKQIEQRDQSSLLDLIEAPDQEDPDPL
ncbi:hypothetical protein KDW20_19245 [Burkholderia cenocepacia]|uniref:hypothetical protein n=1 Tax=Burkholderia cenocepacia TaxID=95486 RepID=UPI001B951040|nr:hypothetical protein [Burkholderia cenocepacia]MBR8377913.1 hypothetical protein [Burkholderia cenocepacia]